VPASPNSIASIQWCSPSIPHAFPLLSVGHFPVASCLVAHTHAPPPPCSLCYVNIIKVLSKNSPRVRRCPSIPRALYAGLHDFSISILLGSPHSLPSDHQQHLNNLRVNVCDILVKQDLARFPRNGPRPIPVFDVLHEVLGHTSLEAFGQLVCAAVKRRGCHEPAPFTATSPVPHWRKFMSFAKKPR